jgi:hypothetical protein
VRGESGCGRPSKPHFLQLTQALLVTFSYTL